MELNGSSKQSETINLPVPIEIDEHKHKHKYGIEKKVRDILSRKGKILDWSGLHTIYRFFYLYLFKKYKHNCRMYAYGILGINFALNQYENREQLKHSVSQFKKCYDSGDTMIVIPLSYKLEHGSHANFLLFKRESHTIEHFEPYGYYKDENEEHSYLHDLVINNIEFFVKQINKVISEPIAYIHIEESCPEIGIQYYEEDEPVVKGENEGNGYCAIWSMFFTELSLANPSLNFKQLSDLIYRAIPKENYLIDITRGYVYFVYEKMGKYFEQYFPSSISFQRYMEIYYNLDYDTIILHNIDDTLNELFDVEMELYEDPGLSVERLIENTKDTLSKIRDTETQEKLRIRLRVLQIMKKKTSLDKFTPITEEQPSVLVMDLATSKISPVPIPIETTPQMQKNSSPYSLGLLFKEKSNSRTSKKKRTRKFKNRKSKNRKTSKRRQ